MFDLIILGMGPSRQDCPYDAEVWGVNNGYRQIAGFQEARETAIREIPGNEKHLASLSTDHPDYNGIRLQLAMYQGLASRLPGKLDKLFICHRGQEHDWEGDSIFDWDEQNALADNGVEIVSLFKLKHVKKVTRLPYRKIVKKFGTEYFSDSIAYMIAYALYLNTRKVKGVLKLKEPMRIRMYGVDMHTKDEYATERGGIEYFIAVARTLGVEFWIHPESSVCKTDTGKPYGFYKLDNNRIDPRNLLELQKSAQGIKKMHQLGFIDRKQFESMIKAFNDLPQGT